MAKRGTRGRCKSSRARNLGTSDFAGAHSRTFRRFVFPWKPLSSGARRFEFCATAEYRSGHQHRSDDNNSAVRNYAEFQWPREQTELVLPFRPSFARQRHRDAANAGTNQLRGGVAHGGYGIVAEFDVGRIGITL